MISLKRTLAKLAVLALSASPAGASTSDSDDCELDASVPIDRGALASRQAASLLGTSLGDALAELPPLDATHLVTTWALSPDRLRRLALIDALARVQPLGARTAIDHLARDPDPEVAAAAVHLLRR
jgi:hypothetical protein